MAKLIWVRDKVGGPFLLNPDHVVRVTVWEADRQTPYRRLAVTLAAGGDLILPDRSGRLLHLLTDGVPEPPEDLCSAPPPDIGPVPVLDTTRLLERPRSG